MVFIDGTNFLHRLASPRLRLRGPLSTAFWHQALEGRQLVRTYFYSSAPHLEKAKRIHGENVFDGLRVVMGDAIPTGDGNFREKGVDALLVADLIYHAAAKNLDHAILISSDGDFAHSLKRVEDFGCRTCVVSVCAETPASLREASDRLIEITTEWLLQEKVVEPL